MSSPVLSTGVVSPPVMSTRYSSINPLVVAGLVPEDISDVVVTPPEDAAVQKKRTMGITGARNLASDEYAKLLREEDRKKKKLKNCNKRGRLRENKRRREKRKKKEGKGMPKKQKGTGIKCKKNFRPNTCRR